MAGIDKIHYKSPLGMLEIISSQEVIFGINFLNTEQKASEKIPAGLKNCVQQLDDYFEGKRKRFELHLQPAGTSFQLHVWDELLKIPYGKTISYLQLSKNLGDEKSI